MKPIFYGMLCIVVSLGLTACNSEEPKTPPPEPQKPAAIQKAEEVEAMLKEKVAEDRKLIDEANQ